jgi:hypothetical protein
MIHEFAECWASSVATLISMAREIGVEVDVAHLTRTLLGGPGALGR